MSNSKLWHTHEASQHGVFSGHVKNARAFLYSRKAQVFHTSNQSWIRICYGFLEFWWGREKKVSQWLNKKQDRIVASTCSWSQTKLVKLVEVLVATRRRFQGFQQNKTTFIPGSKYSNISSLPIIMKKKKNCTICSVALKRGVSDHTLLSLKSEIYIYQVVLNALGRVITQVKTYSVVKCSVLMSLIVSVIKLRVRWWPKPHIAMLKKW